MLEEVSAAVLFIAFILKRSKKLSNDTLEKFVDQLCKDLQARYQHHWFTEFPERGSAYRCIRNTTRGGLDPRICKAGLACGISKSVLTDAMPCEFLLWVDPQDVSYRVGEHGTFTRLSREELVKVHNELKGSKAMSKSQDGRRSLRSSPITIRSPPNDSRNSPTNDELLSVGDSSDFSDSTSMETPDCLQSNLSSHNSNSENKSWLQSSSMFKQSLKLFDNIQPPSISAASDFEMAFRITEAMNTAAAWNVNQLSISMAAGNFWPQNGFSDYVMSQSFTNSMNNPPVYALN